MNGVLSVLARCLVIEFYKQNAAFFGLMFLILFGFVKSQEHIAIGSFLVANPLLLFFLYALWFGYGIKLILFIITSLNHRENQFLEAFYLLPPKIKISAVVLASMMLLVPVIGYSVFLIILSVPRSFYLSILSILISLFILHFLVAIMLMKKLHGLPHEKKFIEVRLLNKLAKPSYVFFIEHLVRNDPVLLVLSKIYTCSMIIGTSALYSTDQFDLRLFNEGILLAQVGNAAILHKYIRFYYLELRIIANLPERFITSSLKHLSTFLLLLIPEIIIILRYYPVEAHFFDVFGTEVFGLSAVLLIYGMLIIKQMELSELITRIFWLIVIVTFLILFSVHPLILATLFIFISANIMYFRRYKFEFVEKNQ